METAYSEGTPIFKCLKIRQNGLVSFLRILLGCCPKYCTGCCGSWLRTCLQTGPPGKEMYHHQTPYATRMLVTAICYHHYKTHTADREKHPISEMSPNIFVPRTKRNCESEPMTWSNKELRFTPFCHGTWHASPRRV